ncbi:MAG: hypothetical protein Kow00105_06740 [Phycisphaeraceae bacterium]
MNKSKLLESLETVLVVTVIAALIWLYAEGETIRTETRRVKVRFVAPTAGLAVSLAEGQNLAAHDTTLDVQATIQASQGDLPRIADWIRNEVVEVEVRVPDEPDEVQAVNLRDALNHSPLSDINAFIKEVDPETVSVRVQQLQTIDMGIEPRVGELELSEAPPTFNPPTVQVTMPFALAQQAREQGWKLIARMDQLDRDSFVEDTQNVETVALELPPELRDRPYVRIQQETVDVTFVVRRLTEVLELPRVQVRLRLTDDITGLYRIRIDPESQRILRVTVRGPSEAIQRIRENPSLVRASILIKLEDLTTGEGSGAAPLDIFLPEGVKVVSTDPNLNTVTYTAEPISPQP